MVLYSEDVAAVGPEESCPQDVLNPRTQRKVLAAGMIGTLIEYFDFLVYATVSGLVFGKLFFPTDNEFVGAMLAISTFAVGFLVRPIGGIVFGHIGDRYGRRRVLSITITMMGIATALIGVLPTYSTIGIAAPIVLVLLRITQGLGVGGEYGAASTMVIEHAHQTGRRGLFGGLNASAGSSGFLLATGLLAALTTLTTDEQFPSDTTHVRSRSHSPHPPARSLGITSSSCSAHRTLRMSPITTNPPCSHCSLSGRLRICLRSWAGRGGRIKLAVDCPC
jgi:MFS family permease